MIITITIAGAVISACFLFAAGFFLGRSRGQQTGFQQGLWTQPLLMREASLTQGYCCLCGQPPLSPAAAFSVEKEKE